MAEVDPFPIDLDFLDNIVKVHWDSPGKYVLGAAGSFEHGRFRSDDGIHWENVDDSTYKYLGNTYNYQRNEDGMGGGYVDNPFDLRITCCTFDTKRKRFIMGGARLVPSESEYPVHGSLVEIVAFDQSSDYGETWKPFSSDGIEATEQHGARSEGVIGYPVWLFYDEPSDTTYTCVYMANQLSIRAQFYKSVAGGSWNRYGQSTTTLAPFVEPGVADFAKSITDYQTGSLLQAGKSTPVRVKSGKYYPSYEFPKMGPIRASFDNGLSYRTLSGPPAGAGGFTCTYVVGKDAMLAISFDTTNGRRLWGTETGQNWTPITWAGDGAPWSIAYGSGGFVVAGTDGEYGEDMRVQFSEDGFTGYRNVLYEVGQDVGDSFGTIIATTCAPLVVASRAMHSAPRTRRR